MHYWLLAHNLLILQQTSHKQLAHYRSLILGQHHKNGRIIQKQFSVTFTSSLTEINALRSQVLSFERNILSSISSKGYSQQQLTLFNLFIFSTTITHLTYLCHIRNTSHPPDVASLQGKIYKTEAEQKSDM